MILTVNFDLMCYLY